MKLLKILQYVYLFFFVAFLYDAINIWSTGITDRSPYLSLGLAAIALFMFFFRKKYRKRFEDRGKL